MNKGIRYFYLYQQFHFLSALFILESGSLAVFAEVSFFFIPFIREQKDFLLFAELDALFNFDGLVVTAVLSFEQGFSLR